MTGKRPRLSPAESEQLIIEYGDLVNALARSLLRKLPPNVEFDDLLQDGYIGLLGTLIQATKRDNDRQYRQYLTQRIRGAMLDGLRENDPGTRKIRRDMRNVERAIHRLSHQFGRAPLEAEVAMELQIPLTEYQTQLQEADGYTLFSLDDFGDDDSRQDFLDWCANTNSDPLAALERRVLQRTLLIAISDLSAREGEVMSLYYIHELTMKDVGVKLNLTEGRISQIHTQAIAKLRAAVVGEDDKSPMLKPRWRTS